MYSQSPSVASTSVRHLVAFLCAVLHVIYARPLQAAQIVLVGSYTTILKRLCHRNCQRLTLSSSTQCIKRVSRREHEQIELRFVLFRQSRVKVSRFIVGGCWRSAVSGNRNKMSTLQYMRVHLRELGRWRLLADCRSHRRLHTLTVRKVLFRYKYLSFSLNRPAQPSLWKPLRYSPTQDTQQAPK